MNDLNRPHTFDGNGILCRCGRLKNDEIHFKPINPHEGATPAVDANDDPQAELRKVRKENAALRKALQPFALFFSALKRATDIDEDNHLEPVLKMGHQALTVGAFVNACAALKGMGDE